MTASGFVTATGAAVPAVTTDQMRDIDRIAVEETGPNLFQMMENAGRSLALTAIDLLGAPWRSVPIVVLAGTGGNGGGGVCAARHLANRGADVTVALASDTGLGPVPAAQLHAFEGTTGHLVSAPDLEGIDPGLVVDAVIGYGLSGQPRGAAAAMIHWSAGVSAPILSLDVPSGIDSTTGVAPGARIAATRTLTLALPKTGLDAPEIGDLWLADLGIPPETYRRAGITVPPGLFGQGFRVALPHIRATP